MKLPSPLSNLWNICLLSLLLAAKHMPKKTLRLDLAALSIWHVSLLNQLFGVAFVGLSLPCLPFGYLFITSAVMRATKTTLVGHLSREWYYWMILIIESSAYFRLLKWEPAKLNQDFIGIFKIPISRSSFFRPFGLTLAVGYLPSSFVCALAKSCYWIMLVCDLPEKRKPVVQFHATTFEGVIYYSIDYIQGKSHLFSQEEYYLLGGFEESPS